jgi:hypothetical protein
MIHFMLKESEDFQTFNWADEHPEEDDGVGYGKDVLRGFSHADPDTIYKKDHSSITWVFDHRKNKTYHVEHPDFHTMLLNGYYRNSKKSVADLLKLRPSGDNHVVEREDAIERGYLIGRTGKLKSNVDKQVYPVIAFWNKDVEADDFDACLLAQLKEFPNILKEREKVIIISKESEGWEPFFLKDLNIDFDSVGGQEQQQTAPKEIDPQGCEQKTYFKVGTVPMEMGALLGKIHNPAGTAELEKLHTAYCSEQGVLRQKFEKMGCKSNLRILDAIGTRFKQKKLECGNNAWDDLKTAGRRDRNAGLRDMFRQPEKIDQSTMLPWFHTQKDIDAAWDELRGKNEHVFPSFLEWLKGGK